VKLEKASKAVTRKPVIFPPYGAMGYKWLAALDEKFGLEYVHPAWGKITQWDAFSKDCVMFLQDNVWPVYDRATKQWRGKAKKFMKPLTDEDLGVLISWRKLYDTNPETRFLTRGNPSAIREKLEVFLEEDGSGAGESVKHYSARVFQLLGERAGSSPPQEWMGANIISVFFVRPVIEIKRQCQRPRPCQAAYLLGYDKNFKQGSSNSFTTPAMISGHAFQAIMGCAELYSQISRAGITLGPKDEDAFADYASDVGDRRILAGLHYPSDSIGSWLIAMRFAGVAYAKENGTKKFIRKAIKASAIWDVRGMKSRPHLNALLEKVETELAKFAPSETAGHASK
jgi:hypothetical protein